MGLTEATPSKSGFLKRQAFINIIIYITLYNRSTIIRSLESALCARRIGRLAQGFEVRRSEEPATAARCASANRETADQTRFADPVDEPGGGPGLSRSTDEVSC